MASSMCTYRVGSAIFVKTLIRIFDEFGATPHYSDQLSGRYRLYEVPKYVSETTRFWGASSFIVSYSFFYRYFVQNMR